MKAIFFLPFLLLLSVPVQAYRITDLYEAEVDVASQQAGDRTAAVRTAMRSVLVRITGDRFASQRTSLSPVIENAEDYLQQYRYIRESDNAAETGDEQEQPAGLRLRVKFDGATLNETLRGLGVSVWGKERPMTLVWVAVQDESGRRLLSLERDADYIRTLEERARRRGITLIFPLMDLEDSARISVSDVWGGFYSPIEAASQRYQADAVLVGKVASSPAGIWEAEWTSYVDDTSSSWTAEGSLPEMVLDEGVDGQADLLVSRFMGSGSSTRIATITIEVNNIGEANQYAGVLDYLRSLSSVSDVQVESVQPGSVRFAVTAHGGEFAIRQAIALGRLMEPVRDGSGNRYRLQP